MIQSRYRSLALGAVVISTSLAVFACSSRHGAGSDTTTAAAAALPASTPASAPAVPMDANHAFLRKMSDHHRGLILIVHQAMERKDAAGIMATAKQLDTEQDAEMDTMTIMLRQAYNDPYDPQVMPEHQAMADSLKALSGAPYDRAFRQDVIRHHQEAVAMVDEYLPRLTDPKIKAMAERMRSVQTAEIGQLQSELSHK
jgi:uncharacterized protein (DUF305 family)